jgi:hypothetical protein
MSPRDHFSKHMHSPYFQTDHYREETKEGILEEKIRFKVFKIKHKILTLFKR